MEFSGSGRGINAIANEAVARFGADAMFGYKVANGFALLTFDEAIQICGSHIEDEANRDGGLDRILSMLDGMQKTAQIIEAKGNEVVAFTRELGRQSLARYSQEAN